jgi:hypothetical protein
MIVYVVYSKSKIHGIYSDKQLAEDVHDFLTNQGGYNNGVPKRFYYMDAIEMDRIPDKMRHLGT